MARLIINQCQAIALADEKNQTFFLTYRCQSLTPINEQQKKDKHKTELLHVQNHGADLNICSQLRIFVHKSANHGKDHGEKHNHRADRQQV